MKKIIIVIILSLVGFTTKAQTPPITDTLQWLRTNIGERSSYFSGKPFYVLLDSLYGLKNSLKDYISTSEYEGYQNGGDSATATSVYTKHLIIFFDEVFGSEKARIQDNSDKTTMNNNTPRVVLVHIPKMYIKFSQKIPFPITLLRDRINGMTWGTMVETLCKYQIVESVQIGEY